METSLKNTLIKSKPDAMDLPLVTKSLAFLSLLLVCIQVVDGFATKNCENSQLGGHINDLLQCSLNNFDKHVDEAIGIAKPLIKNITTNITHYNITNIHPDIPKICRLTRNLIREEILCVKPVAETCFNEKDAGFVSEAVSVFEGDCETDSAFSVANTQKGEALWEKIRRNIGNQGAAAYIKSKITFDKTCSFEEMGKAIVDGPFKCFQSKIPVLEMRFGDFGTPDLGKLDFGSLDFGEQDFGKLIMRSGMNSVGNGAMSSPQMSETMQQILLKCDKIVDMISTCFKPNKCFSEQEMYLIRDTVFTIYNMGMEHAAKTLPRFKEILENENIPPQVAEETNKAVKDFESESCKTKIKSSPASLLSAAPREFLSKFLVITFSVFCIMII